MDKQQFETVVKNFNNVLSRCEAIKNKVQKSSDFDKLTIAELRGLIEEAKLCISWQTSIFQNEIYHILGMGDLTPAQEVVFLNLIKRLGKTRSIVHIISCYQLSKTPTIPKKADYNCKVLGINLNVPV